RGGRPHNAAGRLAAKGIAACEGHYLAATRCVASNLQGGFYSRRSSGARVVDLIVPSTGLQQIAVKGIPETLERPHRVGHGGFFLQPPPQHVQQQRVLVPVVERAGRAAEVYILPPTGIGEHGTVCTREEAGVRAPCKISYMGLDAFQNT